MASRKKQPESRLDFPEAPPARLVENQENRLIAKAYALAEKRLDNETASAQEIVHFLKMGTANAQLERVKLEAETALVNAKREAVDAAKRNNIDYQAALAAYRSYSGPVDEDADE